MASLEDERDILATFDETAMPTEFISITFPNASTDIAPIPEAPVDPAYLVRYARTLDVERLAIRTPLLG